MRQRYFFLYFFILSSFLSKANPSYNSIEFIENRGQWEGSFVYKALTSGSDVFLRKDGFTYLVGASSNSYKVHEYKHGRLKEPQVLSYHAYTITFENAINPVITGSKEKPNYYNYYLGNDPSKWKSAIHPALAIDYQHLYSGIDMHIATDEVGQMKYEFIVSPGSNPQQIQMKYNGQDGLSIKDGNLVIKTSVGEVMEMKPYVYQYLNGERVEVNCKYKITGSTVSFIFPKGYDAGANLVIDPTVKFSTFTGSTADNWGFTATYDNQGNFYAGGFAHSVGYPVTPGAFQSTFGGGSTTTNSKYECDIAITKFDATGTQNLYSTYIGGADNDQPHSLVVDAANNLIIAGRTYSTNYPTTAGAFRTANAGLCDIVVTKLNNTGTALIGSTYVGGNNDDGVNFDSDEFILGNLKHNYGDDARSEVIIDNNNNVYVAACSKSSNFPTANASQGTSGGAQDAVVFKLNPNLTQMIWGTYLGGSSDDAAYVLSLDKTQTHVFVGGGTGSPNFPTTGGTFKATFQGGIADGYIVRYLNSGAYTRERITFLGQTNYDQCYGVQVDNDDNVYAMGQTVGGGFPIQVAPTAPSIYSNAGGSQFIIKLDKDLTTNIYSTVFGAGNSSHIDISPVAFLVDTCQNVYISGWGGTLGITTNGSSTTGLPTTAPTAGQSPLTNTTDGSDFYFFVLSKNGINLLFGGFFGRTSTDLGKGEHVDGGTSRFDKNGIIYQAICGGCAGNPGIPASSFPVTTGSGTPSSNNCNLAALKIEFNLGAVAAKAKAEPNAVLCLGESINFSNSSSNATSYEWDFGDGSPIDNQQVPNPHTYTSIGTYSVRLIAINPNACKVRDTVILVVSVDTNTIKAGFNAIKIDSCGPYTAKIVNTSKFSKTPASTTFTWDFGDGKTATGANPPVHSYNDTGTYTITVVMTDTTACNSPDTISKKVHYSNIFVKSDFDAPDACERTEISFSNSSKNALTYFWYFGDKDTSSKQNPLHTYDTAGQYTVRMYAFNPETCNRIDSTIKVINIKPTPVAEFDFSPNPSERNKETTFTNKSSGATAGYLWDFGDKIGSEETNPIHLYKRTGNYTVCLVAKNTEGCADTACKTVEAIIQPLAELPSGFSPNGDGKNDVFYVRGAGIEKFNLKVYNRWGQLIFEVTDGQANDPKYGWDGSYKGKQQEMEVYAWVLSGSFTDETTFYRKGNVTLLR
jgi:gliding motility-associated-like protein